MRMIDELLAGVDMKGYNFNRKRLYLEGVFMNAVGLIAAIAIIGIFVLASIYMKYCIYLFQVKLFGNEGMLLLSPGVFSRHYGADHFLILSIVIVLLTFFGTEKKSITYIGFVILWLVCTSFTLLSYSVFNNDTIFTRSPLNIFGTTYSYYDVKEVRVYDKVDLLSKHRRIRVLHYDIVMKDGHKLDLLAPVLSIRGRYNTRAMLRVEERLNSVPHYISYDVYNGNEWRYLHWLFYNYQVVE